MKKLFNAWEINLIFITFEQVQKIMKYTVVLFFCLTLALPTFGQQLRADKVGFSLGISSLYGDNTGPQATALTSILPNISVDYSRNFNPFLDLRLTAGWNRLSSYDESEGEKRRYSLAGFPYGYKGSLFFADLMPIFTVNPDRMGFVPSKIKVYGGLGIGGFYSMRTDFLRIYEGRDFSEQTEKNGNFGYYIPGRLGIFTDVDALLGEVGIETTLMVAPGGKMEGTYFPGGKRWKTDILAMFQVTYRTYLAW